MVDLLSPFPSVMLGDAYHENASGDLLGSLQSRAKAAARAQHELGNGGLAEISDVQQQKSSRVEGYVSGSFVIHNEDDQWFRRSMSEKHMQRRSGLESMDQGPLADSSGREKGGAPVSATQRAHSERLQMVGAVDKAEMRSVADSQQIPLIEASAAEKSGRFNWKFSPMSSRRSMTVEDVQLIQSINQGVICVDLQGSITHWNRAAESMYLWKAEEVIGRNIVQLLSPGNFKKESQEVIERVSRGESWSGQFPACRKDGVMTNSIVTDTPVVDGKDRIIGIIGVHHNSPRGVESSTSQSSEFFVNDGEKEKVTQTSSGDGKNLLSWRQVHLEAEDQLEDRPLDVHSSASSDNNYLRIGRSSVQQLMRKLQIGTGPRQGDLNTTGWEQHWDDLGSDNTRSGSSQANPVGGAVEYSQKFPVYVPNENTEADFGERDGLSIPLVVPAKQPWRGEGGSWESFTSQEVIKEVMVNSIAVPQTGTFNQSLSRSSSGSAQGSAAGRDASSVGSPVERTMGLTDHVCNGPGTSINFLQAEEDFQLQLALALRVAAEAAAIDDPDLSPNVRGPVGNTKLMPGISMMEATAYRYWVSSCLSYDDRIEDGFYEIWGMSPYIWSMCTDSSELGRMPPLDNLRGVPAHEASFEVVLVDRNSDPTLSAHEDKAVGLAYESSDVLDMASELSIIVSTVMGGAATSDEELSERWQAASSKLMQVLGTIVLPIGLLRVGLSRHRALLFKVLADSVGLACRIVRGNPFCDKDDDATVVVKCGDDKEWMVDLLVNPGARMAPDKRFYSRPPIIASPLHYERPNPFAGTSVSFLHWSRGDVKSTDGGNSEESPKKKNSLDSSRITVSPKRFTGGESAGSHVAQGLNFLPSEGPKGASDKSTGSNKDGLQGKQGSVELERNMVMKQTKLKVPSQDASKGNFLLEDITKPPDLPGKYQKAGSGKELRQSESPGIDAARELDRVWAREARRGTGSDDSGRSGGPGRLVDELALDLSDFEIAWEDIVMGERIGQGSYGKVSRADWQGSDVAVKVFLDQDLKNEALDEFRSEVAIMRRLRHPNIVLFMGAVTKPPNLSIVTEFCPRGSLYRLLHRPNRELDDRRRIRMAVDVAKGMNYLHRCSPPVVHRDLKSPNLLVDKNWTVKVCDFGLSRQKHSTFLSSKSSAGTPEWMAPEVLRNEPSDEKSDVYSFGVILWELATLQVPWNGMNPIQVVGAVGFQHRRLPIPDNVDRTIAGIIQACWRTDTKLRPSFAELMQELKILQARPVQGHANQTSKTSHTKEDDD